MLFYLFLIKLSKVCTYFRFVPWDCSLALIWFISPYCFRGFLVCSWRFPCVPNVQYSVLKVFLRSECSVFGPEGFLSFRMFCFWSWRFPCVPYVLCLVLKVFLFRCEWCRGRSWMISYTIPEYPFLIQDLVVQLLQKSWHKHPARYSPGSTLGSVLPWTIHSVLILAILHPLTALSVWTDVSYFITMFLLTSI